MKKYKISGERKNFQIQTTGEKKEHIFINMVVALQDFLKTAPEDLTQDPIYRNIKIKSLDLESLLIDFLNEISFFIENNQEFYTSFDFKKINNNEIEVEMIGFISKEPKKQIKAFLYDDAEFKEKDNNYSTKVNFTLI